MKTLLISLLVLFSLNSQAMTLNPGQMTPDQQAQLIDVLNQLDAEVIEGLLSEEALEWYINQFTRETEMGDLSTGTHSRIEFVDNPFQDPKAPRFN